MFIGTFYFNVINTLIKFMGAFLGSSPTIIGTIFGFGILYIFIWRILHK